MFHEFRDQEERRRFGGSCFIELQYCRMEKGTPVERIVSIDSIRNWEDDSLYIHGDDQMAFYDQYAAVLGWTTFMETYGISYFSCEQTADVMEAVTRLKPIRYEVLTDWLEYAKERYNGFCILGI